jgi:hypothetical protein
MPRQSGQARDFHNQIRNSSSALASISVDESGEKPCLARLCARMHVIACTISGHMPVNELHSIENTCVTKRDFSLTGFIEGVQQDRSLTAS